jgi:CBS-domain-containing membrane protein
MGLGIFELISGHFADGLWLFVLGMFLGSAARGAVGQTVLSERLGKVTVADIMEREPVSVPDDLTVSRAREEFFYRYRYPAFPVVDAGGRYIGTITQERIEGALANPMGAGSGETTVRSVMDTGTGERRVSEDTPLESLLGSESLRDFGALMAVDPDGVLRGVVTVEQVRRALHSAVVGG